MSTDPLSPEDDAERVTLFRCEVVGSLARRQLDHGELRCELFALSQVPFRPPGHPRTRRFSVPTLERWLYAYRRGGMEAMRPRPRSDRCRGRVLTPAQRQLLLDIRREHPTASVPLILRTLIADGRLDRSAVSAATVRLLYREHGLERAAAERDGKARLRWQAERPNALWHGDVCHGPPLQVGDDKTPVRIHAILDDYSRYGPAPTTPPPTIVRRSETVDEEPDAGEPHVRICGSPGQPDRL